jgi:hypothetical protein
MLRPRSSPHHQHNFSARECIREAVSCVAPGCSPHPEITAMKRPLQFVLALAAASVPLLSQASSHREAPNIAGLPRVDGTDL